MNRDDIIKLKRLLLQYQDYLITDDEPHDSDFGEHRCVAICTGNLIEYIEAELKDPEKQP